MTQKYIVGLGGTLRRGSSTEAAIRHVLDQARDRGARTDIFAGEDIDFPMYSPDAPNVSPRAERLIEALRAADGVILASPGYHGGVSGLVKNAIDYVEIMAKDERPYFSRKTIGCIATGFGWQGCNSTLHALRGIVHSLRGWPTPLGIAFNSATKPFDADGRCILPELDRQFAIMADELLYPVGNGSVAAEA